MRRLLVVFGALLSPAFACSLAISTDGLAGPPLEADAGPGADGALDAGEASVGPDAADAGDAEAGLFCDQHPTATICADWDHDAGPTDGFMQVVLGGHAFTLSDDAVSPPNALSAAVAASPGSATTSGRIYKELGFIAKTFHLEVDARICTPSDGLIEFFKIETSSSGIATPNPGYEGSDVAVSNNAQMSAVAIEYYDGNGNNPSQGFPIDTPLPTGRWAHFALDIAFSKDANGSVMLYVDRSPNPAIALTGQRTLSASPTAMRVIFGAFASSTSKPCVNLFDNLIVVATP